MRSALILALALLPFVAQAQPPAREARLLQLAETLGRQHYLRTLCNGPDDQTWRTRMARMIEIEAPENPARFEAAFNRGFTALSARLPACGTAARAEAAATARRGAQIAAGL